MLLGITGHAIRERHARLLDWRTIDKETLVETVYLTLQVNGISVPAFCRSRVRIGLASVTLQHQYIGYTRQLQVNERIFGVLKCISVTQDVRNDRNTITMMYGCSHSHRTGTAAYRAEPVGTVAQTLIHRLAMVGSYVYISRIELHQTVDVAEKPTGARTLQRREHLERKGRVG